MKQSDKDVDISMVSSINVLGLAGFGQTDGGDREAMTTDRLPQVRQSAWPPTNHHQYQFQSGSGAAFCM